MKESKNESDRTQKSYDFLSYSDRQELQKVLERSYQNHSIESKEELEESKFSHAVYCHHCGCAEKVQKYGKQKVSRQTIAKTVESASQLSPPPYLTRCIKTCCMEEICRVHVRGTFHSQICTEEYGLSLQTSFVWHHKILDNSFVK